MKIIFNKWSRVVVSGMIALTAALFFNVKLFPLIPPVAWLMSPVHGLWQNLQESPFPVELNFEKLQDSVFLYRDQDDIYHVNSNSDAALSFAQGWLHARSRLWQMEFLSRIGLGETSEIVGRKSLNTDILMARSGLRHAARVALTAIQKDKALLQLLTSYSDGVNAYINSLEPSEYPVEYKFFSVSPRNWQPLHSVAIMKLMALLLSGKSSDLQMSRAMVGLSEGQIDQFFPIYTHRNAPIVKKREFTKPSITVPVAPEKLFRASQQSIEYIDIDEDSGSNSWAVSGKKTASGKTILANDTHLRLTMPTLWQMTQLTGSDYNVFGASITGTPGVIIGHTENVAWAFTNSPIDVLDWYEIKLSDDGNHYIYNGAEVQLNWTEEIIKVRGEAPISEKIAWTHHGPIVFPINSKLSHRRYPRGAAMRWTAHSPSLEIKSIYLLNKARNIEECENATLHFSSPPQNIICADADNISIAARGRMPVKWKRQGMAISDGSSTKYEWGPSIPNEELPYEKNPKRGFVSSANNHTTWSNYPYYLNFRYDSSYRNSRIEELLKKKNDFTAEDFISMQMDMKNKMAEEFVPVLLQEMSSWGEKDEFEKWVLSIFQMWDYRDVAESLPTTIFLVWLREIEKLAWNGLGKNALYPKEPILLKFLSEHPEELLWPQGDVTDHLRSSLKSARMIIESELGSNYERWHWGKYKKSKIPHLSRVPGWGSKSMFLGGSNETILSHKGWHGPNWRMVVDFSGATAQSYAIYPGGTSGNPLSLKYDSMVDVWKDGKLLKTTFLKRNDWLSLPVSRMEPRK